MRDEARRRFREAKTAEDREQVVAGLLDGLGVSHCLLVTPSVRADMDAKTHDLGGGYSLLLPFAEMTSGGGARLEGHGVTPDVEMDVSDFGEEALLRALGERGPLRMRGNPDLRGEGPGATEAAPAASRSTLDV